MVRLILAVIIFVVLSVSIVLALNKGKTLRREGQTTFPLIVDSTDDLRGLGYTRAEEIGSRFQGKFIFDI